MSRARAACLVVLVAAAASPAGPDAKARKARVLLAMSRGLGKHADRARWAERAGDFDDAIASHEKVLAIAADVFGEQDDLTIAVVRRLGGLHARLRHYGQARELLERALAAGRKKDAQADWIVETTALLADVHARAGQYARAEALHRQNLDIQRRRTGEESGEYAARLDALGELYESIGSFAKAEALYRRSLAIKSAAVGPEHLETTRTLNRLSKLYLAAGRPGQAAPLCHRAVKALARNTDPTGKELATAVNVLGVLHLATGRYDRAEKLFKDALKVSGGIFGKQAAAAESMLNLALLYRLKGDYAAAIDLSTRAGYRAAKVTGPDHPDNARFLMSDALLWARLGVPGRAMKPMQSAWAIHARQRERIFPFATEREQAAFARTLAGHYNHSLALVAERMADQAEARRFGLELVLSAKCAVLEALSRRQAGLFAASDPATRRLLAEWRTAAALLDRAAMAATDPSRRRAQEERIAALRRRQAEAEEALARASARFAGERRAGRASIEDVAAALPQPAALVEFALYHSDLPAPIDRRAWPAIRYGIYKRLNLLPKDAKPPKGFDPPASQPKPARPAGQWKYLALVLPGGGKDAAKVSVVPLGPAKPIGRAVAAWRRAAGPGKDGAAAERAVVEAAGKALAALVWRPVAAALGEARQVYLCPDGDLAFVSFAALPGREDGKFLIDDYDLAYLASGRDLLRPSASREGASVLVGAPAFGRPGRAPPGGADAGETAAPTSRPAGISDLRSFAALRFRPLPQTRAEVEAIAAVLGRQNRRPTVLLGAKASEPAVRAVRRPRVLHLATHGFFLPDAGLGEALVGEGLRGVGGARPMAGGEAGAAALWRRIRRKNPMHRSGIALAGANDTVFARRAAGGDDGILTAEEVAAMDLWGTRMVVISACESGLGKATAGEGVFGLRRAFTQAGARHLVMSLWSVSDESTRDLMAALYRKLADGQSPQRALLGAQRAWIARQRSAGRWPAPFGWAAFVASGVGPGLAEAAAAPR